MNTNTPGFLLSFFFSLLLTACGGGDSSEKPEQQSSSSSNSSSEPANTTPTLSGLFVLDAKAASTTTLILNTNDAENDPVQVSIANKPDWLIYELIDNQLKLTAAPGFFDISENEITLTITDGNSSKSYAFKLNAIDNPEKWQTFPITATKIVGQWGLDDGSRLYLYPNGEGSYIDKENRIILLSWNEDYNGFNISAKRPSCATNCELDFNLTIVAEQEAQLRMAINNRQVVANAQKFVFSTLADGNYITPNGRWSSFSKISQNGTVIESLPDVESGGPSNYFLTLPKFKATINTINPHDAELSISPSATDYYTRTMWFAGKNGSDGHAVEVKPDYNSIKVLASAANDLILNLVVQPTLAGESVNINPDDHVGLREYLSQTTEIFYELIAAEQTAQPTITAGDKFYFPFVPARWDFVTYDSHESYSSSSLVVFETETTGYLSLNMPLFLEEKRNAFSWELKDKKLKLTFTSGQPSIDYTFSSNTDGTLNAYTHASYHEVQGPIIKVDAVPTPLDPTLGYYFGRVPGLRPGNEVYNFIYTSPVDFTGNSMQFRNSLDNSEPYPSFWKQEEDGSLTFLRRNSCVGSTFEQCREYLQASIDANTPYATLQYVNYKSLTSSNDIHTVLATHYTISGDANGENRETLSQWLVKLTADLDNYH